MGIAHDGSETGSVADKVAVITGGGQGLGGEHALMFATPAFAQMVAAPEDPEDLRVTHVLKPQLVGSRA